MGKKRKKRKYAKRATEEEIEERGFNNPEVKKSIAIVILFVLAALSVLSFFELAGAFGDFFKTTIELIFGWGSYLFPIILLISGYLMLMPDKYKIKPSNYLGLFFLVLSYSGILQFIKDLGEATTFLAGSGGGYLGFFIFLPLQNIMGSWASLIILLAILLISLVLAFNTSLNSIFRKINIFRLITSRISREKDDADWEEDEEEGWQENPAEAETMADEEEVEEEKPEEETEEEKFTRKEIKPSITKIKGHIPDDVKVTFASSRIKKIEVPLSLLEGRKGKPTSGDIKNNMEVIQSTLENFGILVEMGEVSVGPTVTQFTLKPHQGIKLSRIVALQNDLAMSLAAHPIRIEAPIPGKALVGIEVPNQSITIVKLKDILISKEFQKKKGHLKICLGEDVSGRSWVVDLTSMPHMLIAGATGSGKSVCINNVIISLLYQYTPEELRLIMVDPKKVELSSYNGIPHLMTPVITDVSKTINSLRWVVREMDERFKLLNAAKKRNIDGYNSSVLVNKLPYIVVIIDELADLMVVAARDVETAIVRLSQMARAVGIHLIVATQRPSVNIITGLIKANIPARIAFAVASQIDSRTILDNSGAEKLLGKGDMLFTSAEESKPRRIQGAYLTDDEIERVIDFWKEQNEPDYNEEITESQSGSSPLGVDIDPDGDELLEEAKDIVIKADKASASLLQRRLRVGYARAARLIDLLENQGIVGPADGAKPREILVTDNNDLHIPSETTAKYEGYDDSSQAEDTEDESVELEDEEIDEGDEIEETNEAEEDEEEKRY